MERIPLIIDTDMAFGSPCADIDDAVALLFAFSSPELCVKAVSAAGGNAPPDRVSRNIDMLLSTISEDVPHSFSASRPLDPWFWVDGRWSASKEEPVSRQVYQHLPDSVSLMHSVLSSSPFPMTIVTIGPMTNTALLLLQYPEDSRKIDRIVSMGGSIHMEGVSGGPAEFNIKADPEAASIIFSSGIPVCLFPLDVTKKKKIYPETIASWSVNGPLARKLREASLAFMEYRAKRDGYFPPYSFFHDVLPLAYLAEPSLFTMRECRISVNLVGNATRGVTVVDMADSGMSIATDADSDAVFDFVDKRIMERFGAI